MTLTEEMAGDIRQWNETLFSDESCFTLQMADGRERMYQRVGESFADACVTEVERFRRGSVMVWGGISYHGKTNLVVIRGNLTAQQYVNNILRPVVVNAHNGRVVGRIMRVSTLRVLLRHSFVRTISI